MSTTEKRREEFRRMLRQEFPDVDRGSLEKAIRAIMRDGATHGRLAAIACGRELTRREESQDGRCEDRIRKHCETLGCTPVFSGDPRGHTVKIKVPSGRYDDWGATGICVPTS